MKTIEDLKKLGLSDNQINMYFPKPKKIRVPVQMEVTETKNGTTITKPKTVYQWIEGWADEVIKNNLQHLRNYTVINI